MTSEDKQRSKSRRTPVAAAPAGGYTQEEADRLIAAAVEKLKAGGEISVEEAEAVVSGVKGVSRRVEDWCRNSETLQGEIANRVAALEVKKWKVKPVLEPMIVTPPESGIGKRIAYCRGQLDNLPIEALARYTKHFDEDGISRQSLVRYESGDTMPGAREFRTLCDALWVPANWLLYGVVDAADENSPVAQMAQAFRRFIRQESSMGMAHPFDRLEENARNDEVERRLNWIDEARKPQPRK